MFLGLFLLSVVLTSALSPAINYVVDHFLPVQEVVIRTGNGPIYLVDNGNCELFETAQLEKLEADGWDFHPVGEGYAFDTLLLDNPESREYVVYLQEYTNTKFTFWSNIYSDKISIVTSGNEEVLDLYSDQTGGGLVTAFPFQDSKLSFFLTAGVFVAVWLMVCLFLYILFRLIRLLTHAEMLAQPADWQLVVLLWLVFFLISIYQYASNQIPNFLTMGDQLEYWNPLWEIGPTLTSAAQGIRYWNGYLCFYVPYLCRVAGSVLHIEQVYVWFFLITGFVALMCGYSLPYLYFFFTKKRAMRYQVLLFSIVYVFFWLGTLSAVLMDAIGVSCFLLGVVSWLRCWYEKCDRPICRYLRAVLSSAFLYAAVSFRTVYLYGALVLLVGTAACALVRIHKEHVWFDKDAIACAACLLVAFFVMAVPQFIINRSIDVVSFFPASGREVWSYGTYDRALSEYSMDMTMSSVFIGYPYNNSLDMANAMKTRYYTGSNILTISQELDLFIRQPLEAISYIVTKVVLAFDIKTNVSYPDASYRDDIWDNLFLNLFSFINYVIIGSALYVLVSRHVNRRTLIFLGLAAVSLLLPHTWTHIEWRYYLIGYVIIYFLFSYYFCSKKMWSYVAKTKGVYFSFLAIFIIGYFTVTMNIWNYLYTY